ncbi:calcium-translocating P-type ATPase, SERCA-type [Natranaerobius trueperi]|uniref:calcium-translocating P-type ATPase, SERCA-type n=1 Tax=Natranaerobius trueperi TaxID=759412 RepID=UPI00197B5502|nr:calcium-translocating P-type ATPase, SERCA-type [Natranaerobius trueperi]
MSFYIKSSEETEAELSTSIKRGLSYREVSKRQKDYGENSLKADETFNWWEVLLDQFRDFMVLVLLAATTVSGLLGEYTDAITIIAIVVLNAILGFYQEFKAEKSLQALKELTAPEAKVIRDGEITEIPASEIVPGDIVYLESGDRVPADIRLNKTRNLEIVESSLTGESLPVKKHEDRLSSTPDSIGDINNMAFMGTMVTKGSATGIVTDIGMETEMGQIAHMLADENQQVETPLQKRLANLGKVLVTICLLVCIAVAFLGVLRGEPIYKMFMAGVSLAVAAIPEGLPAVVTIALAVGVQKMMKKNALVRKLPAVETLGCATVICSDKTGTLTTNKMIVDEIYTPLLHYHNNTNNGHSFISSNHKKVSPKKNKDLNLCFQIVALCNNTLYTKEQGIVRGEPTEKALLQAAVDYNITPLSFSDITYLDEIQFDSNRKRMSVFYKDDSNQVVMFVKGAPEVIVPRCKKIITDNKNGELNHKTTENIMQKNEEMANKALRNIAVGYKVISYDDYKNKNEKLEDLENDLIFVGLMGLLDPPREEVKDSILKCKKAGVTPVMITGDHKATAIAIAKKINLFSKNADNKVMDGKELDSLSDRELNQKINNIRVFARVSPKHKLRIVSALKDRGNIVAMTGDGVNDAPAVKSADIGIAMGVTGTDVTKGAAELILADDNFSTIEAAIEEGRGIYDNIRKFIRFLLSCNFGEILTMLFGMLMGLPLPLKPIQILWVNLVTDGLPAIALGVDPKDPDIMKRKPRDPEEGVFSDGLFKTILGRGLLIGLITIFTFYRALELQPDHLDFARTMGFSTLVVSQLIYVFECQSVRSGLSLAKVIKNPQLIMAVIASFMLFCLVVYIEPLAQIFDTHPLNLENWMTILVLSLFPTVFSVIYGKIKDRIF